MLPHPRVLSPAVPEALHPSTRSEGSKPPFVVGLEVTSDLTKLYTHASFPLEIVKCIWRWQGLQPWLLTHRYFRFRFSARSSASRALLHSLHFEVRFPGS